MAIKVEFTNPYTARLVKLLNIVSRSSGSSEGAGNGLARPSLQERASASQDGDVTTRPARPTFEEMMAVVNRPRRRRG